MSIRPEISGFSVLDGYGRLRGKVPTWGAALALDATLEPVEAEFPSIERIETKEDGITHISYPLPVQISQTHSCGAISSKRPWRSRALGVNPVQAEQFTNAARDAGISGVEYCPKSGDLVTTSNAARNREFARRGYGDGDACYGQRPPGG